MSIDAGIEALHGCGLNVVATSYLDKDTVAYVVKNTKDTNYIDGLYMAIKQVKDGSAKRIEMSDKVIVYRAGTVVRVDIKD